MPVPKKKRTTSTSNPSISEQASSALPEQRTFHEHLRALTRSAVRAVIEEVMREELKQFLGAAWGECTPKRKGYRNGTYTRDLATSSGPLEDLHVPRDREGNFHSEVFDRYSRYEPDVAEGLTQMFVAGVSMHKVGDVVRSADGSCPQCQYRQSAHANVAPLNLRCGVNVHCWPTTAFCTWMGSTLQFVMGTKPIPPSC